MCEGIPKSFAFGITLQAMILIGLVLIRFVGIGWVSMGIFPGGADEMDKDRTMTKLVAFGIAPRGIIAIGLVPMGFIAIGGVSMGIIAVGAVGMGLINICLVGCGLIVYGVKAMGLS